MDIPAEQLNSMSRLERARYKAMKAAQNNASRDAAAAGQSLSDSVSVSSSTNTSKLQKLQKLNQDKANSAPVAAPLSGEGLVQSGTVGGSKLSAMLKHQRSVQQQRADAATDPRAAEMQSVLKSLQQGLNGPYKTSYTDASSTISKLEEEHCWTKTAAALQTSREVALLFSSCYANVEYCFSCYAETLRVGDAAVPAIGLAPNDQGGGVLRLFEAFAVTPAYVSKKELKCLFALALAAQRNCKSPFALAAKDTGNSVLDFTHFLKLLMLVAQHALSKTSAFNSLYPTPETKLSVLLTKCGLSDLGKIKAVQQVR